ncbi:hypothetical protein TVAG_300010 [Trichomonas vaginalis G3]|uniref:Uncharacterized protein n=1 Tax=Trichomonas vaginalis (strain ATCC PRA-98 / G3) TaxID=412133 RepID=A2FAF4_TRIV3|nr:hypothetical protein TVAGG3_0355670 [Trichomonas vaginalis G3]EAX98126.1 hypothetical protein TVAG_300010 [Trichomonas vaginalis G3]KAI5531609.1 hypothetical protein TVAGG3_0355670 [Trichomonas vaginalis G3]|eukprot:XP_001311056.1 hypothetical protein [Trichomonas vaginalis G3]
MKGFKSLSTRSKETKSIKTRGDQTSMKKAINILRRNCKNLTIDRKYEAMIESQIKKHTARDLPKIINEFCYIAKLPMLQRDTCRDKTLLKYHFLYNQEVYGPIINSLIIKTRQTALKQQAPEEMEKESKDLLLKAFDDLNNGNTDCLNMIDQLNGNQTKISYIKYGNTWAVSILYGETYRYKLLCTVYYDGAMILLKTM